MIANALIAFYFLRERFHWRNALGLCVTLLGSGVVVLNAPAAIDDLDVATFLELIFELPAAVYLTTVGLSISALLVAAPTYGSRFVLVNVMLCSLLGSITVLCSAAISNFISEFARGQPEELLNPLTCILVPVLVSTAVLQLKSSPQTQPQSQPQPQTQPQYLLSLLSLPSLSSGT